MKAAERVKREILELIASGDFAVDGELPSEAQLAEQFSASRLTLRESISVLTGLGVISVRHGRRNRVAPIAAWSVLDPQVIATRNRLTGDSARLVSDLMEARRALEVGIARLAAERITDDQLHQLQDLLEVMRHHLDDDTEVSAHADIRFHQVIETAADNAYLKGAFQPLQQMLLALRIRTSSARDVREAAIAWHQRILDALSSRDPEAAAHAMNGHMDQTVDATLNIDVNNAFQELLE